MKKLMFAMVVALAVAFVGAPTAWAAETITGTVDKIESEEGAFALTIVTKEGKSLILQADPHEAQGLKSGDQVEVTHEGKDIKAIKKF